nr:5'/3'-nucleotidase SurE [Chloroflexota bacterium]
MDKGNHALILITNDDGIASPGLVAAVRSVLSLAEVWVVAPSVQCSGLSRSFIGGPTHVEESNLVVDGTRVRAFAVDKPPAQVVRYGLLCILPRMPDLVISGINYGENLGAGITISGTIGAALEAAGFGIPTLAASLETERRFHFSQSTEVDFSTAAVFVHRFAKWLLTHGMPRGIDILKLDVPCTARPHTPWRFTRVSRQQYWVSPSSIDIEGQKHLSGYVREIDYEALEPDSDIHAVAVDRVISISPLTIDLTAKVDLQHLQATLSIEDTIP